MSSKFNKIVLYIISFSSLLITTIFLIKIDFTVATKTEVGLLYVLQFISSIVVTFMYSRDTTIRDFKTSNERFAESSYRRIDEIECAVREIEKHMETKTGESQVYNEVKLSFIQLKHTISSSKYDWELFFDKESKKVTQFVKTNTSNYNNFTDSLFSDLNQNILEDNRNSKIKMAFHPKSDNSNIILNFILDAIENDNYFDVKCFLEEGNEEDLIKGMRVSFLFEEEKTRRTVWLANSKMVKFGGILNDKGYSYDAYRDVLQYLTSTFDFNYTVLDDIVEIEYDEEDPGTMYKVFYVRLSNKPTK